MVSKQNVTNKDRAAARSFLCDYYNVYIIMIYLFFSNFTVFLGMDVVFLSKNLEVFEPLNIKILQSLLKYLRHPNVQDFNPINTK